MDTNTKDKVRTALAELDQTGVSYVLMVEDEAGAPAFFCNDPNSNFYLVTPKKEI
jgi:hypothetical protein